MNTWSDLVCTIDGFWIATINHLWQATLFATFVALLLLVLKRIPVILRYSLCLIASFKFILASPLVVYSLRPVGINLESIFFDLLWTFQNPKCLYLYQQHELFPIGEIQHTLFPFFGLLVWLIGSFLVLRNWISKQTRFSALVTTARQLPDFQQRLRRLSLEIGLHRTPELRISSSFSEPGVWGVFHPVIVIPETMRQRLTRNELDAVLLHELTHIARHDNLVAHLNMAICVLFWFHPLVWWLDRRMLAEREIICDARVIQATGATPDYRNGLLKVLQLGSGLSVAGISCAGGGDLRKRIRSLMTSHVTAGTPAGSLKILLPVTAALLLLIALTVAAVPVLPLSPPP